MVKRGVHVSGASPESISSLLSEVAECGTHYARLSQFSLQPVLDSLCGKGLVFQVWPPPHGCHPLGFENFIAGPHPGRVLLLGGAGVHGVWESGEACVGEAGCRGPPGARLLGHLGSVVPSGPAAAVVGDDQV